MSAVSSPLLTARERDLITEALVYMEIRMTEDVLKARAKRGGHEVKGDAKRLNRAASAGRLCAKLREHWAMELEKEGTT